MNHETPTFDPRDLRPFGRRSDDRALRRPVDESPVGRVDVMLYGMVCSAHLEAERCYFRALDRELELGGRERERAAVLSSGLNGKAEGLAEAVALLVGDDVVEVRRRASLELEKERARNLEGVDRARAALRR